MEAMMYTFMCEITNISFFHTIDDFLSVFDNTDFKKSNLLKNAYLLCKPENAMDFY